MDLDRNNHRGLPLPRVEAVADPGDRGDDHNPDLSPEDLERRCDLAVAAVMSILRPGI